MGGPTKCPESALTVSDFAFLWATVMRVYGRSDPDEKPGDIYVKALAILAATTTSEALRAAIWGVDLNAKNNELAFEQGQENGTSKRKAKVKGKKTVPAKVKNTVPAPVRGEAGPSNTPERQGVA